LPANRPLNIDSSERPAHGPQEQSAYNGHFESVCYHPLFVFNPDGDCLAAKLRPGNVHSADGWDDVLLPIIDRYRAQGQTVVVRAEVRSERYGEQQLFIAPKLVHMLTHAI